MVEGKQAPKRKSRAKPEAIEEQPIGTPREAPLAASADASTEATAGAGRGRVAKARPSNRRGTGTGPGTAARGERRRQLLTAAIKLFSERPYEDIFIADIADAAGVAHGLLFYYFKDKRGIYLEALKQVMSDLQEFQRPRPDELTTQERLRGTIRRHFDYLGRHHHTFIGLRGLDDPDVRRISESAHTAGVGLILQLFDLDPTPPPIVRAALRGWVGFLDEITLDWLAHDDVSLDDIVRITIEVLTAALSSVEDHHPGIAAVLAEMRSSPN
ncbi:TetR/AcrR family transcriptional regulator [Embleya sp. NPDC005971]|uniref:TetR/AcrR family transcriptional regulator n=1 Tax=Embleya sp. NPDC005971 TaxID=3156724 RepID=UPI0033BFE75A